MALCYLARRTDVPALQRALGARLAQPAGAPRHLSSISHQVGHCNEARRPLTDVDVARLKAEFGAECDAVREAMKTEDANSGLLMKSCLAGVGMALITIWHSTYKEIQRGKALKAMLE